MKFIVDENIRNEIKDFLADSGHDVIRPPLGCKDEEIASLARIQKSIIITHDVHFSKILMYPPVNYHGIIRIKIHPPVASVIIQALKDLFKKVPPEDMDNKLIILEKKGFRSRP